VSDAEKEPEEIAGGQMSIRWLEGPEVAAEWEPQAARLSLRVSGGDRITDARAALAFPVSAPGRFVDLCDAEGKSVGMLRKLADLAAESRGAVEAALSARYLIPRVERIVEITETAAFVLNWRVQTDRGPRTFQTESPREAVKYQGPDRIRITDMAGNHYDVPGIAGLDAASRALLAAYL
jgi:hypothetical protein